jgi:hypothetical protein
MADKNPICQLRSPPEAGGSAPSDGESALPAEYLGDILPRLARGLRLRDVAAMLPAAWTADRQTAAPVGEPAAPVS